MPVTVTLTRAPRGGLQVFPVEAVQPFGVEAFVTDRAGGVSAPPYDHLNLAGHVGDDPQHVAHNRALLAAALGVELAQLVIARQVHGDRVLDVVAPGAVGDADGLVTVSADVALVVLVADCLPILLVDTVSPRVGVVHAGWRGLRAGVVARALAHFATPRAVHAFVGPSISTAAYQVGPEVAAHFAEVPGAVALDVGDRSRLDLRRVAVHQLVALGLADENITLSHQVTDGGGDFFSDRAARPSGRFALVAKRAS